MGFQTGPSQKDIDDWFSNLNPNDIEDPMRRRKTIAAHDELRRMGKNMASTIIALCPPGPDTAVAIRKVREAVMTAYAAIAINGVRTPRDDER